MKNEKRKRCPSDHRLTAYGGDLEILPRAVKHLARRAQIPFLIFNFSFFVFNLNSRTSSWALGSRLLFKKTANKLEPFY
jgi:hypothetical protein